MTEDRIELLELLRKSGEPEFLRELVQLTVQRLMAFEWKRGAAPAGTNAPHGTAQWRP